MGFFSSVAEAIQRPIEVIEAQQRAIDLGIYDIVCNIVKNSKNAESILWEGCTIIFERHKDSSSWGGLGVIGSDSDIETTITMPDGTVLYNASEKGKMVTSFRYGGWVERIKAYSEQLTTEKRRADEAKAQQEREGKLKPFSGIDF